MQTEFAVPVLVPAPTTGSLIDHILENAANSPDRVCISVPRGDAWVAITSTQFLDEVRLVAKGIIANGVQSGERIAIMSRTRYEWTLVDYAIWYAGAVSVPVYETSSPEQIQWNLSDSGAVAIFLESTKNKAAFDQVSVDAPSVTRVWVFDDGIIERLKEDGKDVGDDVLEARRATLTPDTIATIIYTSGTTGRPKGCMLTHKNCMFEVDNVVQGMPDVFLESGSSTLLFLPIAHVFGRLIELGCVRAGVNLGHSPTSRTCFRACSRSSRPSCSPCRESSRRSSTPLSRRRTPTGRAASSTPPRRWPSTTAWPWTPADPGCS